jgi:hypothetical protein
MRWQKKRDIPGASSNPNEKGVWEGHGAQVRCAIRNGQWWKRAANGPLADVPVPAAPSAYKHLHVLGPIVAVLRCELQRMPSEKLVIPSPAPVFY